MSASPAKGSTVPSLKHIELQFNEAIEPAFSYFDLLDSNKRRILRAKGADVCNGKVCQSPVEALKDGTYQVHYHVLSDDGHVVEADYTFTVKSQ